MISNEDSASSNSTDNIFLPSPSKRCRVLSDSKESSSSSLSDLIIPSSICRRIESDSESEFEDDENDPNNRLSKITHIIDILNRSFKEYYNPDEILCVDESLVPFRGRIIFRQYLKQKRHRYGIKIFKLCSGAGYTYSFQICTGKEKNRDKTAGTVLSEIVMTLCKNILSEGHTVCADNWYTSVDLAEELIAKNTHLMGTLRKNRRGNSVEVVSKKLKRGELIARENKSGITILKWKDKRDILMLSTKHSAEMATVHKKFYSCEKPKMIVDYNLGKSSVDLSDQMIAYSSPLKLTHKTLKWYRKLAIELLWIHNESCNVFNKMS
ncbi:hypothetical protein ACFW04_008657 [Cataglyphis niger]